MKPVLPPPGWIGIPASVIEEAGTIWLREPDGKNRQLLIRQLRDNIYPHPFVIDDGKARRLHFSMRLIQSEMRVDAPFELMLAYTRVMMGCLLFVPEPRHVVIAGLGGGSLTKYCHRQLDHTRITALEISTEVIACRDWFLLPPDDARLRVLEVDAADHFAGNAINADIILFDAYDDEGLAPRLGTVTFYENLRSHLKPKGVMVANISGHSLAAETHIALIEEAFHGRCLVIDVVRDGNRIVFAFRDALFPPAWRKLVRVAMELEERHPGIDFARLLHDLEAAARRARRRQHSSGS